MADWQGSSYVERRWKHDPTSHSKVALYPEHSHVVAAAYDIYCGPFDWRPLKPSQPRWLCVQDPCKKLSPSNTISQTHRSISV